MIGNRQWINRHLWTNKSISTTWCRDHPIKVENLTPRTFNNNKYGIISTHWWWTIDDNRQISNVQFQLNQLNNVPANSYNSLSILSVHAVATGPIFIILFIFGQEECLHLLSYYQGWRSYTRIPVFVAPSQIVLDFEDHFLRAVKNISTGHFQGHFWTDSITGRANSGTWHRQKQTFRIQSVK